MYGKLVEHFRTIEIGTVHEIDQGYLEELETENPVNGAYIDLRQYTVPPNYACQLLSF